jgi:PAS domain S-box-containing protein
MASIASRPLTKIGFRRDVKLFLTFLVGFLVVLIFVLVAGLRLSFAHTEGMIGRTERVIADIATDAINRTPPSSLQTQLLFLRGRYQIAGLELQTRDGRRLVSGVTSGHFDDVTRLTGAGTLRLHFDAEERDALNRRFVLTSGICVAAASLGIALLLLYVPRILRPIEAMLDEAKSLGDRGDQEESAYLIETFRNSITTLRSQEDELKRLHGLEKTRADDLERVTAALTRSLTSGLIAADAQGVVVDVNAAGREILGIDAAAPAGGRALRELVPLPHFAQALAEAFAEQQPVTRLEVEDLRNGEAVIIGLTTVPLRNEEDEFLGLLALFTDLTPIRSLETRVQEMQTLAQLGEISAGIAHELRNSVSTILGYMKLARRGGDVGEAAATRLQSAEKEAALLLQAIERLLAFARPIRLNAEPVDLRELVDDQVRQLGDTASDGTADVRLEVSGPSLNIDGDRVLLSRAIENLLRNAVDAVREKGERGGAVRVTLTTEPPTVTIRDTGIGFDPAETARLFLPFHSNKANGFGMGLPLAKKIVLLHGGTLRLHGEPGGGAVAVMEFSGEP